MTQDTPRIQGIPDPRKPAEADPKSNIDPEKFKKILKVDESDESKQQDRRQKTKKEEEEEIDEPEEARSNKPSNPNAFGAMMSPPPDTTSIFDNEAGSKPDYGLSSATTQPSSDPISLYSSSSKTPEPTKPSPEAPSHTSISVTNEDTKKVSLRKDSSTSSESTEQTEVTPPPKKTKRKETSPLPKSEARESDPIPSKKEKVEKPKEALASPEPAKPREQHEAETTIQLSQGALKKGKKEAEERQIVLSSDKPKELQAAKKTENKTAISEEQGDVVQETITPVSSQKTEQSLNDQKKDREKEEEKKATEPVAPIPAPLPGHLWSIPPVQSPAYATLQSDVFELFEKMVGVMTIEQTKGVSKTTITLNMPGSVFHGSEIHLDHYDTAPHAYNVQLLGSPQAVAYFNANINDLVAAFQQSRLPFEMNIQRPLLLSDSKHLIKRKGKGDGKDDERQGKNQ